MKKTAVDILIDALSPIVDNMGNEKRIYYREVLQQARELGREQIEDAYADGLNAHRTNFCNRHEYFTKTYGGTNETAN